MTLRIPFKLTSLLATTALLANILLSSWSRPNVIKAAVVSVSLSPVADAFVAADLPTTNYGTRTTVEVDGSPIKVGYIKFDLSSLAGKSITLAEFRHYVKDGSASTFNFKAVSDNSWGETTMTYSNRPSVGTTFATRAAPTLNTLLAVNMTSYIAPLAGQTATFAIDSTGTDGYSYYSKNSSTNQPVLYVEYADTVPSPTPTPTPTPSVVPSPTPSIQTRELVPAADTFASAASPTTTYGTRTSIEVDGSPIKNGYIKFDLSALDGKVITLAKYRMTVRDGSVSTFNFRQISDNVWQESTVTYNTQPTMGSVIATLVAPVANSAAEVDLTSYLSTKAGQIASIGIDSTGTDGYSYYSKESSTTPPRLYVEYYDATPPITGITIAAAGDIACNSNVASPSACQQMATSDLVLGINPSKVFALGDLQYGSSTLATFNTYYHPSWGRFKNITSPVLGNHEDNVNAYFDYWNGVGAMNGLAGPRPNSYYSYDLGGWHIVALNSNCAQVAGGGCAVGSAQESWLRSDLAAHPAQCTLAFTHHSYFTSGTTTVDETSMKPLIQALYDNGVDVLLAGHKHMYERFAPQNPDFGADPTNGIRSFTVGTGGKDLSGVGGKVYPNLVVRDGKTFGVLKMVLGSGTYSWQFVPTPGGTFTDSGNGTCH